MKTGCWFSLGAMLLFCVGCAAAPPTSQPVTVTDTLQPAEVPPAVVDAAPAWVQATQLADQHYENLNLDGIGDADDEVYISVYAWGYEETDEGVDYNEVTDIIVVRVRLGTGETVSHMISTSNYLFSHGNYEYSVFFGPVFSDTKEAIVLELPIPGSNYWAVDILALDVFPPSEENPSAAGLAERLNTIDEEAEQALREELGLLSINYGTAVVDVPGQTRQGISVQSGTKGDAGAWHQQEDILLWQDGRWVVVEPPTQ